MTDSDKVPFLKPVLRGGRFQGAPSVPLDFLAEFVAYEKLVLEVARALFLQANPKRRRVPAGFEESFQLVLAGIEAGSTIPVLMRDMRNIVLAMGVTFPSGEMLTHQPDFFGLARDRVTACVESVALHNKIPPEFPRSALRHFERFGEHLRPDESIELRAPNAETGPSYTRAIKDLLITESRTDTRPVVLVGRISGVDGNSQTFNLDVQEPRERHLKRLPYRQEMHAALAACLAKFVTDPQRSQARILATACHDRSGKITDIVEVAQVQPLDGAITPVPVRIAQLRALAPGWLDGLGQPPSAESLSWITEVLAGLPEDGSLPRPYLYPTPDGSVQIEWDIGAWSVTVEVAVTTRHLAISALNTQNQVSHDYEIVTDHTQELINFLRFLKLDAPSHIA